jgi:DNA polymerase (family X)
MVSLDASAVAKLLVEYGRRTALAGGNPYRSKAYLRAAESLAALAEPLERIVAEGRLREIPGVGDAIADIITKLHRTGSHPSLERMRREIPEGVLEMLSVPGLRPDKILKLHKQLGITSLAELEAAARDDRIKNMKGLGLALQRKIVQGLEIRKAALGSRHMHRAAELMAAAEKNLRRAFPGLKRIVPAGDFRRGCELACDLSVVAEGVKLNDGPELVKSNQLSVYLTDPEHFGSSLLLATGSDAHLQQLRTLAERQVLSLSERGLRCGDKTIAAKTEASIYQALGLQYIEPELREGRGEIALARNYVIPKLVELTDLRGILHAHTDQSDGANSLSRWPRRPAGAAINISAWPITRNRPGTPAVWVLSKSERNTPRSIASTRLRRAFSHIQGHRVRYSRRRIARLSRRGLARIRFHRGEHPRAVQDGSRAADGAPAARGGQSVRHYFRSHDGPAAAAPVRL